MAVEEAAYDELSDRYEAFKKALENIANYKSCGNPRKDVSELMRQARQALHKDREEEKNI